MAEEFTGAHDAPDGPMSSGAAAGPLADEARKLLSIVQDWAQRTMPEPPSGHGGPECQWCPLCQLASILRGEYPEVTERVAEAGAAVAGAVRALVETALNHAGPQPTPDDAAARPAKPSSTPRVQRIHLDGIDGIDGLDEES